MDIILNIPGVSREMLPFSIETVNTTGDKLPSGFMSCLKAKLKSIQLFKFGKKSLHTASLTIFKEATGRMVFESRETCFNKILMFVSLCLCKYKAISTKHLRAHGGPGGSVG